MRHNSFEQVSQEKKHRNEQTCTKTREIEHIFKTSGGKNHDRTLKENKLETSTERKRMKQRMKDTKQRIIQCKHTASAVQAKVGRCQERGNSGTPRREDEVQPKESHKAAQGQI